MHDLMVRFFDAESNLDEEAIAYTKDRATAMEFGMRLAIANPERGVQVMAPRNHPEEDGLLYDVSLLTIYPTKREES